MEEYVEFNQTYQSANSIRIAVVPVGNISNAQFTYYLNLIKGSSACEMIELSNEYKPGAFPSRNWKEAKIYLNFETTSTDFTSKDDSKEDWRLTQAHRRTMAVVGIVLAHQYPDLSIAKQEFANITKSFSNIIATKCFAFEPMLDQPDLDAGNLVMIPYTRDPTHLNFYVKTQILDLTSIILKELESWVANTKLDNDQNNIISSIDTDKANDPSGKIIKKRTPGRWSKLKGDYCLLSGSPKDAIGYYLNAIEQGRGNHDYLWLGGALEGYNAAILLDNNGRIPSNPNNNNIMDEYKDEITEKANEAIQSYQKKGISILAVEASLKLARYFISLGKKKEASDILMTAYESSLELSLKSKITACGAIALLFKSIGFMRKFAFFIRETAVFYHKVHNIQSSHNLLKMVAKYYQLQDLDEATSSLVQRTRSKYGNGAPLNLNPRRPLKDKTQRDWFFLQKVMLQNLIKTAKGVNDQQSVVRYIVHLMKTVPDLTSTKNEQYVTELLDAVQSLPSLGISSIEVDMIGLPLLKKITPLNVSDHLYPVLTNSSKKKSIWLYTPYQRKEEKQIFWVQNEIAEVKVELANPTHFELEVQSITLSTSGVEFEPYSISFTIPPLTSSYEVIISGKPIQGNNVIEIKGCNIRCYNLSCEHPISEEGIGLSLKEYNYQAQQPKKKNPRNPIINKINVVETLPLLSIQEASTNGSKIKLYEGQRYTFLVNIENIGTKQIDALEMVLHELLTKHPDIVYSNYELVEDAEVYSWDKSLLASKLPLMPGDKIKLPIHIFGKRSTNGGDFMFTYSSESQPEFGRSYILNVPLQVKPALQVQSFNIATCSIDMVDSKELESYQSGVCLIVCEIVNPTGRSFELDCFVKDDPNETKPNYTKTILIEPNCVKRLILPLKRFTLDPSQLPPLRQLKGQFVKSTLKLTPEQELQSRLLYWYKNELNKRIKVQWRCLVLNTIGDLDLLRGMPLTIDMLPHLQADMVHFSFELSKEDDNQSKGKAFYPVRQFKTIGVRIQNITSDKSLTLRVHIQPYQDLENGTKIINLGGKFAWVGCLETLTNQLKPGDCFLFNIKVCFLTAGTFKFLVTAEDSQEQVVNVSEVLKLEAH